MADSLTRTPSAPPTSPLKPDDVALLLAFLRERDVSCPRCDYNLRDLTQPNCPECREPLALTVGVRKLQFGLLIAALVPGSFSGIAAFFLMLPLVIVPLTGGGGPPWQPYCIDAFGWLSGIFAVILFVNRYRFLKMPYGKQRMFVAGIWAAHILALGLAILSLR